MTVINDGQIQQIGTPEDIYLSPANTDIAQLFGDPVINLLDVMPRMGPAGPYAIVSDQHVALSDSHSRVVDKPCVLGLRPEALHFVDERTPGAIPVTVETETPLNEKTVTLAMTARGREIMLSRPAGTPGPKSGPAHIGINEAAALLFDRESKELIPPNGINAAGKVA